MVQCGIGDMLQIYSSAPMLPRLVNRISSDRRMPEIFYHTAQPRTPDLLFLIFTTTSTPGVTLKMPYMSQSILFFCSSSAAQRFGNASSE